MSLFIPCHIVLAQIEISELENKKLQEIEAMRQHMVKITNEAALAVLGLKNDLSKLERSYNESRALCFRWEKILAHTKDVIAANYLEKQRSMDAIDTLYHILCRRRSKFAIGTKLLKHSMNFMVTDLAPDMWRRNVEGQLDFIKIELEILQGLLREFEAENESDTEQNVEAYC